MNLNKREIQLLDDLELGAEDEVVTNPFSGRSILLSPQMVALYDYIKGCEITRNVKELIIAKVLFAKLNPKGFSILID
jgi:hypothetical protein